MDGVDNERLAMLWADAGRSYHVHDTQVAVGEGYGIGWGGHRQHEGQRGRDGAGQQDVEGMQTDGRRLGVEKVNQIL